MTARILPGWLADRRSGGHLTVVAAMLGTGAVGLALLATAAAPALLVGTALFFGLGWCWPGLLTYAVVRFNLAAPAVATSFTQTGVFVGSATGPLVFGLLVQAGSYRVAGGGGRHARGVRPHGGPPDARARAGVSPTTRSVWCGGSRPTR